MKKNKHVNLTRLWVEPVTHNAENNPTIIEFMQKYYPLRFEWNFQQQYFENSDGFYRYSWDEANRMMKAAKVTEEF